MNEERTTLLRNDPKSVLITVEFLKIGEIGKLFWIKTNINAHLNQMFNNFNLKK